MNNDMTAVLTFEQVAFQPIRKKFTVNDFHKMTEVGILAEDGTTEIIKGELVERMPIGSRHAGVVARLSKLFEKRVGDESIIWSQNPIHLDDYNEPLPDVALLKLREDFYTENNPRPEDVFLLAEVSDSTARYDREEKTLLYAQAGIPELWLINVRREIIEIYTQPDKGNYRNIQIYQHGESIRSITLPDLQIAVDEILGEQKLENDTEN